MISKRHNRTSIRAWLGYVPSITLILALTHCEVFGATPDQTAGQIMRAAPFPSITPQLPAGDVWLLQPSETFKINADRLAQRLKERPDSFSLFIFEHLSESARLQVEKYGDRSLGVGRSDLDKWQGLVRLEFNKLITNEMFYSDALFVKVELGRDTRELLSRSRGDKPDLRLNRLLLEDAFPHIFPSCERILSDPGASYLADVNFRNKAVQLYDLSGKKRFFFDLTRESLKSKSVQVSRRARGNFIRNPGIGFYSLAPAAFKLEADDSMFEINVTEGSIKFLGLN